MTATMLARVETALGSLRSVDEATFLEGEDDFVGVSLLLLEKRAFFDNPDRGRDEALRRCARDTTFASGARLGEALLDFGLHMGDPSGAVRAWYLEAWAAMITAARLEATLRTWMGEAAFGPRSHLAVAWLDLLKEGRTTAMSWRASGARLIDIVE